MSKGLEALDDFLFEKGTLLEQSNNLEIVKKELQALEIIRNIPDNYKEGLLYTFQHLLVARKITQEEYDLLKEVLS